MRRLGTLASQLQPQGPEPPVKIGGEGWRLSPPLALTVALQAAGLIAWGAYLEARVASLEHQAAAQATVGERLDGVREDVGFIRRRLEK